MPEPGPDARPRTNGVAVAGLVVALLGLPMTVVPILGLVAVPVAALAAVLGVLGAVIAGRRDGAGRRTAVLALVLAVLDVVLVLGFAAYWTAVAER